jgi:hypothetical protein
MISISRREERTMLSEWGTSRQIENGIRNSTISATQQRARFANRHGHRDGVRTKGESGHVNKQLELTRVSGYGLDLQFIRSLQRTHSCND